MNFFKGIFELALKPRLKLRGGFITIWICSSPDSSSIWAIMRLIKNDLTAVSLLLLMGFYLG